jgi:hypothetical protein
VAIDRSGEADEQHVLEGPDGAGSPDAGAISCQRDVLANPEHRVGEHQKYKALVDQAYGWAEAVPEFHRSWGKLQEKYGYSERTEPIVQPEDGSWEGVENRKLDAAQNAEIDRGYARILDVGARDIIPGIAAVAAEDQSRTLAGYENRFKEPDRVKEKVADLLEASSGLSAVDALGAIVDVVRFTYTYSETRYTPGVMADVERIEGQGFVLDRLKNTWTSDQYRGINTQWLEPKSGVLFEVQFHTEASLEAKELTHKAYERIRTITQPTPETDRETAELEAFQSEVNTMVPIPPDVSSIENYGREKRDG